MTPTLQIAVLERGFVYVGLCASHADGRITITNAQNVRRWGTTAGLGQLAMTGPTSSTKLDKAGTVHVPNSALIHLIDCNPEAWPTLAVLAA